MKAEENVKIFIVFILFGMIRSTFSDEGPSSLYQKNGRSRNYYVGSDKDNEWNQWCCTNTCYNEKDQIQLANLIAAGVESCFAFTVYVEQFYSTYYSSNSNTFGEIIYACMQDTASMIPKQYRNATCLGKFYSEAESCP